MTHCTCDIQTRACRYIRAINGTFDCKSFMQFVSMKWGAFGVFLVFTDEMSRETGEKFELHVICIAHKFHNGYTFCLGVTRTIRFFYCDVNSFPKSFLQPACDVHRADTPLLHRWYSMQSLNDFKLYKVRATLYTQAIRNRYLQKRKHQVPRYLFTTSKLKAEGTCIKSIAP